MVCTTLIKSAVEKMTGTAEHFDQLEHQKQLNNLIVIAVWLVLFLMIGKWLWNNVAVKVTTFLKPLTSIWQLLALAVLVDMIRPTCC
jgi:hypothetical protein